jgi:sugar phosphate isomerase/epimerase
MTGPFCVFPKFLRELQPPALAEALRKAGLDGIALPVREGYWCQPNSLARDLPGFIKTMRGAGLTVPYAIINESAEDLVKDPTPLAALAEHGIRFVRIAYIKALNNDPRQALADGRRAYTALAAHALRLGVRVIVQLHHYTMHPSPSAAWLLVEDLPAKAIGIKIDPGNQIHEGWEDPARSLALLGSHLAAVGVKDATIVKAADGKISREWTPLGQGLCEWPKLAELLKTHAFTGPFVFSPFYHENDRDRHLATLSEEVRYLRGLLIASVRQTSPPR